MKETYSTIVLSRPDRLGDAIISTSAIEPILDQNPAARIVFAGKEFLRPILEGHPRLAGFLSVNQPVELLTKALRTWQASAIVHLERNPDMVEAAFQAGIPIRAGYFHWPPRRGLTHWLPDRRRKGWKHEGFFNFDLLGLLGIVAPERLRPSIHLPEAQLASLERTLGGSMEQFGPFFVLNPSAFSPVARWPVDYFVELDRLVRLKTGWNSVIIGDNAADPSASELASRLPASRNLAGKTSVAELAWLLRSARCLVTRDTGPSHVAAAAGCPVVVLFGRTAPIYGPRRWQPLGDKVCVIARRLPKRWFEPRVQFWQRCFAAISPEEVCEAVLRLAA